MTTDQGGYFPEKVALNLPDSAILAFTCVKDERERLDYFLTYYRKLGVAHFFFVDNNSSDLNRVLGLIPGKIAGESFPGRSFKSDFIRTELQRQCSSFRDENFLNGKVAIDRNFAAVTFDDRGTEVGAIGVIYLAKFYAGRVED